MEMFSKFTGQNDIDFWLFSLIVFFVPALPFIEYWNSSYWAVSGALLLLLFLSFATDKKLSIKSKTSWVDIGFTALLSITIIHFVEFSLFKNSLPSKGQYLTFILLCVSFLYISFFCADRKMNWNNWVSIPFTALLFTALFVLKRANEVDFRYASLMSALDYANGLGNISQIAMHISFYCILIFFLSKHQWVLLLSALVTIGLIYLLDSKMLGFVLFFCLTAKCAERLEAKHQLRLITRGLIGAVILVLLWRPSFLTGRLGLWALLLSNVNLDYSTGIGLGEFSTHVNQLFLTGKAVNTIGEINQLCFNDFLQVFLELGIVGIIGLGFVFYGITQKKTIFYLLALGFVLFFMFPLQYIESAVLFALTVFVLQQNTKSREVAFQFNSKVFKNVLLFLTVGCLGYTAFQQLQYSKWSEADLAFQSQEEKKGLNIYQQSLPRFIDEDAFFLRYGLHLKQTKSYNDALRILNHARVINPSYHSFIYRGDCYYDLGFYEEAINEYKNAQLIRPEHLYPSYKMIFAWYNSNAMNKAKRYWLIRNDHSEKRYSPTMQRMYHEIEALLASS